MKIPMFPIITIMVFTGIISGCVNQEAPKEAPPPVIAIHAATPIIMDGRLDEKAWELAPVYYFQQPRGYAGERKRLLGKNVNEPGGVRMVYDDKFLYVGFELADRDLLALKDEDQQPHWQYGDVVEFFIKAPAVEYYHELYATPLGRKSSWRIPGGGCWELAPYFPQALMPGFEVAVQAQGTVNDQKDRDKGWTVEMKIPLTELQKDDQVFKPGTSGWTVQFIRANYGNSLPAREPTCFPRQSSLYFHAPDRFAELIIK